MDKEQQITCIILNMLSENEALAVKQYRAFADIAQLYLYPEDVKLYLDILKDEENHKELLDEYIKRIGC